MKGSVNPGDTPVVTGFDVTISDDRWTHYQPSTDSKQKNFEAFKRALHARKITANSATTTKRAN